ncbi:MAG: hypothetical protein QXW94_06960, partial [Desulfurococcaceae archaeon]
MTSIRVRVLLDFSILTLLTVLVFRNWIFTRGWPAGGDVMGWISRAYLWKDFKWLYVWRPWSFGFPEDIHTIDLFMSLIYYICNDAALTVKVFTILSFLMAGFSIYIFAFTHTNSNLAAFTASMIYCFNPWFFSQLTEAHVDIIFSHAFVPFLFLLLDNALRKGGIKNALCLGLGLALLITGLHRVCALTYGAFLVLFVAFFFLSFLTSGDLSKQAKRVAKNVIPSIIIALIISLPSFIPIYFFDVTCYTPSYGYPLEDVVTGSYENMMDALALQARESWGY